VKATLSIMKDLINKGKTNINVRELALSLVKDLPPKDWWGEAQRIHNFVRDEIRYVKDIRGVETVHPPERVIELGQGDCDDKSILSAALLSSIGHPTRLVAMGFNSAPISHVITETKIGNKWVPSETTMDWKFGKRPSNITSTLVKQV